MGKMFNLWIDLCLFTNHSLRQPVMLRDAASLQPLSEASQLLPNQPQGFILVAAPRSW